MARKLLITGLVVMLLATGCNSNDPLITAEANKRNADAERTRAETKIKYEDWLLKYAREQSKLEKEKTEDELQTYLDAIYAPIEREENLKRQWTAFWLGAGICIGLTLLGAGIIVDRYRLARRTTLHAIEDEARQARAQRDALADEVRRLQDEADGYRNRARMELGKIRQGQQKAHKQLAETQGRLTALQDQCRAEEEKLKQLRILNAQLVSGAILSSGKHPNNGDVDPEALPAVK